MLTYAAVKQALTELVVSQALFTLAAVRRSFWSDGRRSPASIAQLRLASSETGPRQCPVDTVPSRYLVSWLVSESRTSNNVQIATAKAGVLSILDGVRR